VAEHATLSQDAVEVVRNMKDEGANHMTTMGSLALCRSLLRAGLVDRFRVVVFPVITASTGSDPISWLPPSGELSPRSSRGRAVLRSEARTQTSSNGGAACQVVFTSFQGFPSDRPVASRLQLPAAARRPVIAKDRPRAASVGREVHLIKLSGGCPAHDDELEPLIQRSIEELRIEEESNVDPALVDGVGVHDLVRPVREAAVHVDREAIDDELVLDLANPHEVRAEPTVHLSDDRGELVDLPVTKRRCPPEDRGAEDPSKLLGPPRRVLLVEQVLDVPPGNVVGRRHGVLEVR
jgi:RibD C-terminal domain